MGVYVLLHNVRSLYNVGAFFRTADAVGISKLYLSGFTGTPPSKQIAKTALGAEQSVPWERVDAEQLIDQRRRDGCETVAIETVDDAIDLFDWTPRFPCSWFSVTRSTVCRRTSWNDATRACGSQWLE